MIGKTRYRLTARETAFCGLFGAAALMLPVLFHAFHLGRVFMPMYLPLVALAYFVRPLPAAVTALVTPLLSGAATGMPPFFPPVAVFMAIELSAMAAIISAVMIWRPSTNEWVILVPVLLLGRILYLAMIYLFSLFIDLPAAFVTGFSLISGWPGIVLMIGVVPFIARAGHRASGARKTI